MNAKLSIYNGVKDTQGRDTTIAEVRSRIKHGGRGLAEKTKLLNVLYQTDNVAYTKEKVKLPAVTWSGTFLAGKRLGKGLLQHSGYVVLDVDNDIDLGTVLADFAQHPNVALAFVSPSGTGVKPVIPISPIPTTPAEHKHAFDAVLEVFHEYAEQDPKELPKQRDVNRLCLLAHDPRLIDNPNAIPVEWDPEDVYEPETDTERVAVEIDEDSEGFLKKHGIVFDADGASQYLPKSHCQRTQHKSNNNAVRYFKNSDGSLNGYCNGCRESWYLVPPKKSAFRKPVKLVKQHTQAVVETLESSRQIIAKAFNSGARFLGLRADTGVGKSHESQVFFLKGASGFFSTPTGDLAREIYNRFFRVEIDAYLWRGVAANPDGVFPYEKPCMFPNEYIALAERGRNAFLMLCERCQYYDDCHESGYRSQEREANGKQVIVASHKDILFNPVFRSTAKRLLPSGQDDLVVVDEFDPLDFIEISVSRKRLVYLRDTWQGHTLGDFAQLILNASVSPNMFTAVKTLVEELTDTDSQAVMTGLSSLNVDGKVLSKRDAETYELEMLNLSSLTDILALPRIESEDWNLLIQLEMFFSLYTHAETAPMEWQDDALTFSLPPTPLYTTSRVLCMSATLNETFFRQVFKNRQVKRGDVDFMDVADTAWHERARVFQLRTNRNPRRTLLVGEQTEKGWTYTGALSSTGEHYYQLVFSCFEAHPDKKQGIISYKPLIAAQKKMLDAQGVVSATFGNLVGLDTAFEDVEILHVLGSPEVGASVVEETAKRLYGLTEKALDFTRNEDGTYTDSNVQQVYIALVIAELVQAVGRARLVIKPSTVVVWTSHELPSITHRKQTLLFDDVDFEAAGGNLDKLPPAIATREAAEVLGIIASEVGDVKGLMEATGQTDRNARRQTADVRKQNKAERNAELFRRYDAGETQQAIAEVLGINKATVSRVLAKRVF